MPEIDHHPFPLLQPAVKTDVFMPSLPDPPKGRKTALTRFHSVIFFHGAHALVEGVTRTRPRIIRSPMTHLDVEVRLD
jgi:hypothetical protein